MTEFFDRKRYIDEVVEVTKLSDDEIKKIHEKYTDYVKEKTVYAIPIIIWAAPQPYKPLRINRATGHLYVPDKAKLVKTIRDLILDNIGDGGFKSGLFPINTEVIMKVGLYLPTPKSFNRESKYLAETKILRPSVKPDVDNISKIVNDAVKAFIINDDAQIVTEIYEKFYSLKPRMEVTVIYSTMSGIIPINNKLIKERKERWNRELKSEKPPAALYHLRKYSSSSTKRI